MDVATLGALILCGGKGERLRAIVSDRPKPLAEVNGHPFLDYVIDFLIKQGVKSIYLLAGYMGEQISQYAQSKTISNGIEVCCFVEPFPLGTAGAIKHAVDNIVLPRYLVLNGDTLCPLDIKDILSFHAEKRALATLALSVSKNSGDCGAVNLNSNCEIIGFHEKDTRIATKLVNAGVYVMEKAFFEHIPTDVCSSLEYDIFPKLIGNGVYGFIHHGDHLDIGTPERYRGAQDKDRLNWKGHYFEY